MLASTAYSLGQIAGIALVVVIIGAAVTDALRKRRRKADGSGTTP